MVPSLVGNVLTLPLIGTFTTRVDPVALINRARQISDRLGPLVGNSIGVPVSRSVFAGLPWDGTLYVKVFNNISHVYGLPYIVYDQGIVAIDTISTVMNNTCLICDSHLHVTIGTMYL
jgi:hypothetical protein